MAPEQAWEIIERMREAVPAGQARLDAAAVELLRDGTRSLHGAKPGAAEELARFRTIAGRKLCLPGEQLAEWLDGAHLLVTGGTGCIGAALMQQLALRPPARVVSVSRGVTASWPRQGFVEYRRADIRDRRAIDRLVAEVRPDVIFHLAAQRDPALAEVEVHRTVSTNILGARNVLAAAADAEVAQVVCASTGKALRPYSPDVYAASKRVAEWVASEVIAEHEMLGAAARFTHVVDNSLIHRRLQRWARDGVVRLHSADTLFYVQSALESAQLLLVAGLDGQRGQLLVHAITDLGWPISLLDLALGVLAQAGYTTPIYFSGYDQGYEEVPFPGLYDPATAGEVSPLLNALEAALARQSACPMVDSFPLQWVPDPTAAKLLAALEETCARTKAAAVVRARLDEMSWSLLDAALRSAPPRVLARAAALADPHQGVLNPAHGRILEAIREVVGAQPGQPPVRPR